MDHTHYSSEFNIFYIIILFVIDTCLIFLLLHGLKMTFHSACLLKKIETRSSVVRNTRTLEQHENKLDKEREIEVRDE